jgi:PAS domain S-box-containing protein
MCQSVQESVRLIPEEIFARWQDIVDLLSELFQVPTAVISKIEEPMYEIVCVNRPNPHAIQAGKQLMLADVYCEAVFKTQRELRIENALNDERWRCHPEVQFGYISYLGFPIFLPSGELFGTICVFDTKPNAFREKIRRLMLLFKDQIEAHLGLICRSLSLERQMVEKNYELTEATAKLIQEIMARKQIRGALRESEKRFQSLVESSLVGISIHTQTGVGYQNPEHRRIVGEQPPSARFPFVANIHPEEAERVKDLYEAFAASRTAVFDTEFRFCPFGSPPKPSEMKWIHCRAIHIQNQDEPAVMANLLDITRMKELETRVRIEDKMSSLGRVTAGIAHEMRNPLSAINLYLRGIQEACQEGDLESGDRAALVDKLTSKVREATDLIEGIIKKTMDFARPSPPQMRLIDLNDCVTKAVDLSSVNLQKRGVHVELQLEHRLPPCLADPLLVEQVLLNLISNAADALAEISGPRRLAVSSTLSEGSFCLRVEDSGPGIPEELRDKVFDPFFTTKDDGSGIGLSMARRIISNLGGRLDIGTSRWGGTEFIARLPGLTRSAS